MTTDRDEDFEAFLQRRSPLNRGPLHEHESLEPPEELDRIVLSRARQAISQPAELPVFRSARWAFPLALAATIVLSFTIVVSVNHKPATMQTPTAQIPSATSAESAEAGSGAELPAEQQEQRRQDEVAGLARQSSPFSTTAPAPAGAAADAAQEKAELTEQSEVAVAGSGVKQRMMESASPVTVMPAEPPPLADVQAPDERDEEVSVVSRTRGAFAPPEAARRADPEVWMNWILDLRSRGKRAEAEQELRELRKAYPEYPVPMDIQRAN